MSEVLPLFQSMMESPAPQATTVPQASCATEAPEGLAFTLHHMRMMLHLWSHYYYILDTHLVDDRLYDLNINDLKCIEERHPECIAANSPTQHVGCGCPHCFPDRFSEYEMRYWADEVAYGRALSLPTTKKMRI